MLGSGLISSGPQPCRCESDGGEIGDGEFLEAGGDAAEVFELVEVSLDQVALAIDCPVDGTLNLPIALGRNMCCSTARFDPLDQCDCVIPTVRHHMRGVPQAVDECGGGGLVAGLSGADRQSDRQTCLIHDRVDLGAQSATRTTDGVIRAPFFPPAACWWARMIELSMNAMDSGDLAAKALKTFTQTPALAHRLKRL